MATTTISLSGEMKEKIRQLGKAGDSYDDIIRRMYEAAKKTMMLQYLYDESDSVGIDEAIADARRRCPRS